MNRPQMRRKLKTSQRRQKERMKENAFGLCLETINVFRLCLDNHDECEWVIIAHVLNGKPQKVNEIFYLIQYPC